MTIVSYSLAPSLAELPENVLSAVAYMTSGVLLNWFLLYASLGSGLDVCVLLASGVILSLELLALLLRNNLWANREGVNKRGWFD